MEKIQKTIAVLTILASPSYFLCARWHICMAGHMQHGPYPYYQRLNDSWWLLCYVIIFTLSILILRAKRRLWFIIPSITLIISRIPMGSAGGGAILIEIPLIIIMNFYAIMYLIKPKKYITPEEKTHRPPNVTSSDPT